MTKNNIADLPGYFRCDTYNISMDSKWCIEYQARARGTAKQRNVQVNGGPRGILVIWAQKFRPCLTCKLGKQIKKNGGKDMDDDVKKLVNENVRQLESAELSQKQGKIVSVVNRTCERCGWTGPEIKFHLAGQNGHINVCRQCIVKKRKENKEYSIVKTAAMIELGPQALVVDFADYPEILETLQADARRNFRTLQNEILFRLVQ